MRRNLISRGPERRVRQTGLAGAIGNFGQRSPGRTIIHDKHDCAFLERRAIIRAQPDDDVPGIRHDGSGIKRQLRRPFRNRQPLLDGSRALVGGVACKAGLESVDAGLSTELEGGGGDAILIRDHCFGDRPKSELDSLSREGLAGAVGELGLERN